MPARGAAHVVLGLLGLVHGVPSADVGRLPLSVLQATSYCHDVQMQSCPGYANVMKLCCQHSGSSRAQNETCARYMSQEHICGGPSNMRRALGSCCELEWSCKGGWCGSPGKQKGKHLHVAQLREAAASRQASGGQGLSNELTGANSVMGQDEENIEVITDGTEEGIEAGYAAEAAAEIAAAPKFEMNASDSTKKCVSISSSVDNYWCSRTCAGSRCPKKLCKCGAEGAAEEEPEISCVTLSSSVTEHWCRTTCRKGGSCPKELCKCGTSPGLAKAAEKEEAVKKESEKPKKQCVSLKESATDFWCTIACNSKAHECPKICSCGDGAEDEKKAAEKSAAAQAAKAARDAAEKADEARQATAQAAKAANDAKAAAEAKHAAADRMAVAKAAEKAEAAAKKVAAVKKERETPKKQCVSLKESVTDFWCTIACNSKAHKCPQVCSCGDGADDEKKAAEKSAAADAAKAKKEAAEKAEKAKQATAKAAKAATQAKAAAEAQHAAADRQVAKAAAAAAKAAGDRWKSTQGNPKETNAAGKPAYTSFKKKKHLSAKESHAFCHEAQMRSKCPGYNTVMMYCCDQSSQKFDSVCDSYMKTPKVCGEEANLRETLATCCDYEYSCHSPDGWCGPPNKVVPGGEIHNHSKGAAGPRQQVSRRVKVAR